MSALMISLLGLAVFNVGFVAGANWRRYRNTPKPSGPRLPHHRSNVVAMRKLPEWQEHQRDVDHLEAVSKATRDEVFWMGEKK